ncbi:MAG TPA: orotidine-5'-phosphate decarboxylase [Bacillota bacterium]|nr:orotidine-5'-phosphate decarboxylase [Bacillota bacterium]
MENVYLALDFPDGATAKNFITANDLQGVPLKIGMELFYREGPAIIEYFKSAGHRIFLDLKLHDIPNTVNRAMKNLAALDIDIVNVHATGGAEMIKAAKDGLLSGAKANKQPYLIAVTVLTSFAEKTLQKQLKVTDSIQNYATHLAKISKESGANGVVCSVHEARHIKDVCGEDFLTITPGIRLKNSAANDQQRIATPQFAKQNGSSIIVVGRTITQASNPRLAYERVIEEWTMNE